MDTEKTIDQSEIISNGNGELSHSDKMIGVFTEPSKTFFHISKFPARNKDWVLPILIFCIVVSLIRLIAMTNEEVFFEEKRKGIERIEKMVEDGTLSREEADEAINGIDQQMEFMKGPAGWVITIASTLIFGIVIFLIIVGVYFLFIKFLLKGSGNFTSALVASGLTSYINILQIVIAGILTMVLGRSIMDTSLASFLGSDKTTLMGWFLAKIDPFSIWAYFILAIGFARMFKSESTGKYYALVFGVWLIGMFILLQLSKALPFLQNFLQ